ncbi:hypothetical protein BDQ12DRAFT_605739 [Crucibulum laeve]|uniref:DOMON domain-containing protein n=1 Tax=Crucibulum laeve TaxID=68775 RepID=A0A5C3M0Y9_9AGAR|nr:hypothetical protein BDQ12DRAFT_605739 [Crucibulum laeve]
MRFNTTVSNISPLLLYLPQALWSEVVPTDPGSSTRHVTNSTLGYGTVSFSWQGTGIWIYGGPTASSSKYRVTMNGISIDFPNSDPNSADAKNGLLFRSHDNTTTSGTSHHIELTNLSGNSSQPLLEFDHVCHSLPKCN